MVPTAAVVSGPGGCISLTAGISGPSKYKRTNLWIDGAKTVKGRTRVLQPINGVNLGMACGARCKPRLIDAMHNILGHRSSRRVEDRWLVHVIPKAFDAVATQVTRSEERRVGKEGKSR